MANRNDSQAPAGENAADTVPAGVLPQVEESLSLGPQSLPDVLETRVVEDAEMMKALADPLRLKIMRVLGKNATVEPRIMTVKQLAEELGEPTTKLYRHIKQLVAVELIQVAELRLVGGIVEQHYRAAQASIRLEVGNSPEVRDTLLTEDTFGVLGAAVEDFCNRYEEALRAGRTYLGSQECLDNPPHVRSVGLLSDYRIPRAKAVDFGERLHALAEEFTKNQDTDGEDAVDVNMMAVFYATEPKPADVE